MNGWSPETSCRTCGDPDCSDAGHERYDIWMLRNDAGEEIAVVQQFYQGGPYYGTTNFSRTGPLAALDTCQARCLADIEAGKDTTAEAWAAAVRGQS